jgi:hypothetical protein
MAAKPKPIKITPNVRIVDLLERADKAPLVLEQNGVRYRLSREDEVLDDGEKADRVQAMLSAIGSWKHVDADAMIQNIYRWRREGSRPADWPHALPDRQ